VKPEDRPFIAWDGEGQNLDGTDKPQSYVLFGCSTGDRIEAPDGRMSTLKICKFIMEVAEKNPHAIHVGFAFNYDTNMIVKSLPVDKLRELWDKQFTYISDWDGTRYCIRICRSKWLSISRHEAQWRNRRDAKGRFAKGGNYNARVTVKIYDIFSFFSTSFVKAVRDMLGDSPELRKVLEGKKHRGGTGNCVECGEGIVCLFDSLDYVRDYWSIEIKLLAAIAQELRKRFYEVGFKITKWYGPGALASFNMKKHGTKAHMEEPSEAVKDASQYAYAGGRFESYKVGRVLGPVYSYDINSAYPAAIALLPSMAGGVWEWVDEFDPSATFAVYNVRLDKPTLFATNPGPLFYRDAKSNISYPWTVEGWYWWPELWGIYKQDEVSCLGGWVFRPATIVKPFEWIREMYDTRLEWKEAGNPNQMALKLTMNSMYGKMAQRVGWTVDNPVVPPWHQLEWAGWVTAYCRGMIYDKIRRIPFDQLVAVETDGFYTTVPPEELDITESKQLGEWGIDVYDEVLYFQSGLAWLRQGDTWVEKRRGLDAGTFGVDDAIQYAKRLGPVTGVDTRWQAFVGKQTRFIGLGAALAMSGDVKDNHCRWETSNKEVLPGRSGKRIHVPKRCRACMGGKDAYTMAHDLCVSVDSTGAYRSTAHYIPWRAKDIGNTEPSWMELDLIDKEMIAM